MSKQRGRRTHARDSRGRKVANLYRYDYTDANARPRTTWSVSFKRDGRQHMVKLDAHSVGFQPADLTEAKKARDRYLVGLADGSIARREAQTFAGMFAEWQDARSLSERTRAHEQYLLDRLADVKARRVQTVTASEVAKLLRRMRGAYSPWTQTAVYRVLRGVFALAVRRGTLTRSPMDGLAASERPRQQNAKSIRTLTVGEIGPLVAGGSSERWRAALGLAAFGGLRLGEVRGLRWGDVYLDTNVIRVERSLLPNGSPKATKTKAGQRAVPVLPALRRVLVAWRLRSPRTADGDLVIGTAEGAPVAERNLRRSLAAAVTTAGIEVTDGERLSWHALRHAAISTLATDLALPATTLSAIAGHSDAGFTLRVYAHDPRDPESITADVLARAEAAGVGV
jgi:integrase